MTPLRWFQACRETLLARSRSRREAARAADEQKQIQRKQQLMMQLTRQLEHGRRDGPGSRPSR